MSHINLGCLANYSPRRNVQEFPITRLDNSIHNDHCLILPEGYIDKNNELFRFSQGESLADIDWNNINAEVSFKGLSYAMYVFENFLQDLENRDKPPSEFKELMKEVENHLHHLEKAFNLFIAAVSTGKYAELRHKQLRDLIEKYVEIRESRFKGAIETFIRDYDNKKNPLDEMDQRLMDFYRSRINDPIGKRPLEDGTLFELRRNLKSDIKEFKEAVARASSLVRHTVDDPDILSSVAEECSELWNDQRHKDRAPLIVTPSNYVKFMRVCPDRFVRRMLWETYNKRCSPKALPKLSNIIRQSSIRSSKRKIAMLCGYRNHLEYRLRNSMAKTKQNVMTSLSVIDQENRPKLVECMEELSLYAYDNQLDVQVGGGLQEYDLDYWTHRYSHEVLIGLNSRQISSFFPLDAVVSGCKKYLSDYLSLELTPSEKKLKTWSPDVRLLELKRNGEKVGNLIFDPFQIGTRATEGFISARVEPKLPSQGNLPAMLLAAPYRLDRDTKQPVLSARELMELFYWLVFSTQVLLFKHKYYELNFDTALECEAQTLLPFICLGHFKRDHKILQSMSRRAGNQAKPMDVELASRVVKCYHHFRPLTVWRELYEAHLDVEVYSVQAHVQTLAEEIYPKYSPFERFKDNYDHCAMQDIFAGQSDATRYSNLWSRQVANGCLKQMENSDGQLDNAKLKDFFGKFVDLHLDGCNVGTQAKLATIFGPDFEPNKSNGLGVL